MKKVFLILTAVFALSVSAYSQNVNVVNNTQTIKPGTATYAKVLKSGNGQLASISVYNPTGPGYLIIYEGTTVPAATGVTAVTLLHVPIRLLANTTVNQTFPIPLKFVTGCVITWSAVANANVDTTANPNDLLIAAQVQ